MAQYLETLGFISFGPLLARVMAFFLRRIDDNHIEESTRFFREAMKLLQSENGKRVIGKQFLTSALAVHWRSGVRDDMPRQER